MAKGDASGKCLMECGSFSRLGRLAPAFKAAASAAALQNRPLPGQGFVHDLGASDAKGPAASKKWVMVSCMAGTPGVVSQSHRSSCAGPDVSFRAQRLTCLPIIAVPDASGLRNARVAHQVTAGAKREAKTCPERPSGSRWGPFGIAEGKSNPISVSPLRLQHGLTYPRRLVRGIETQASEGDPRERYHN